MTQICQRPRNDRNFDKNISTIIKMNASCTQCAIMKRRWIKLAKISMNARPAKYGGFPEVILVACPKDFNALF